MRDEFERLATEWGIIAAISVMAVGVRFVMKSDRITTVGILRGLTVGLFVGGLANGFIGDMWPGLGDGVRGALVGACAILAEDIIAGVLFIGARFRNDPHGAIRSWFGGRFR